MRLVVDTNVFVSAALKEKSLLAIAVHPAARHGTILESATTKAHLLAFLAPLSYARLA